jgi:hypothetical protein
MDNKSFYFRLILRRSIGHRKEHLEDPHHHHVAQCFHFCLVAAEFWIGAAFMEIPYLVSALGIGGRFFISFATRL